MAAGFRVFLSTVTSEFGAARDAPGTADAPAPGHLHRLPPQDGACASASRCGVTELHWLAGRDGQERGRDRRGDRECAGAGWGGLTSEHPQLYALMYEGHPGAR